MRQRPRQGFDPSNGHRVPGSLHPDRRNLRSSWLMRPIAGCLQAPALGPIARGRSAAGGAFEIRFGGAWLWSGKRQGKRTRGSARKGAGEAMCYNALSASAAAWTAWTATARTAMPRPMPRCMSCTPAVHLPLQQPHNMHPAATPAAPHRPGSQAARLQPSRAGAGTTDCRGIARPRGRRGAMQPILLFSHSTLGQQSGTHRC